MSGIFTQNFDFLCSHWEEKSVSLNDIFSYNDKTILYFYPKDNTPGCTVEAKDFTCLKKEFEKLWVWIVGVSKDSIDSHKNFLDKQNLDIDLISDSDLVLHKHFSAYGEKNNYGKIVMWVIRSTFLIDRSWNIIKDWKNVRAKWHAKRVFEELKNS